jgi:hypothetical protein
LRRPLRGSRMTWRKLRRKPPPITPTTRSSRRHGAWVAQREARETEAFREAAATRVATDTQDEVVAEAAHARAAQAKAEEAAWRAHWANALAEG